MDIKPREKPGEEPLKWNWDSPLILSRHSPTRLYFAAQKLYRSDDRGDSWTCISDDLTRKLDRDQLKVMGKIQSIDAVAKNRSTSFYGNCVSLDESPVVEGLMYVGSDDGVISVTEDAGTNWRRTELFPGIPDNTYVSWVRASQHDANVVYASFDNHKNGDFKPYVLKSTDRGRTWTSVTGDLPDRHIIHHVIEDHVYPNLLFVGTEFGVYFTVDAGTKWIRLKGGLPTIAVRDIDIQKRENDLVLGTFGRSFYVLDDYSPLRTIDEELLKKDAVLFSVKPALRYVETSRLGGGSGRAEQGASFFLAPNPPYGAVFTYYLKEKLQTRKEKRREEEKKASKAGKTPKFPTIEELRAEDEEKEPKVFLTVRNEAGEVIRRIDASREKGLQRTSWDLRDPSLRPTQLSAPTDLPPWVRLPAGPLALPGTYTITLSKEVDGVVADWAGPEKFEVVPLELATFAAKDRAEVMSFHRQTARLQRAVLGSLRAADEAGNRIAHLRKALTDTPSADAALLADVQNLNKRLLDLQTKLRGDQTLGKHERPAPPSIAERVDTAIDWYVTSAPTKTQREAYQFAADEFGPLLADLRKLMETDLKQFEAKLEQAGAPWTPGRLPEWKPGNE